MAIIKNEEICSYAILIAEENKKFYSNKLLSQQNFSRLRKIFKAITLNNISKYETLDDVV